MIANYTGLFIIRLDDWQIVGQVELAGDEFIIKKFLDDLKSKLPFKKKLTDEEEEYEDEEGEEEIEEDLVETSNTERTQFVNTSDLEDDGYEYEEYEDDDEGEEEEEGDEDAPDSLKGKILNVLNQIKSLGKKKNKGSETDDGDDEVDSDDVTEANIQKPGKNKNKLIVQAVIVLGLVYFIADEFMKDDVPEAVPQLKARPDQLPTPTTDIEDQIPAEDTPQTVVEDETPQETPSVTESDMNTDVDTDTETETTATEPSFEDTPSEPNDWAPAETITEDTTPDSSVDQTPDVTPPSITNDDQVGGQLEGNVDIYGDLASPIEDQGGDLTEKILQDLETQTKTAVEGPAEYVAPPDYEYPGRGLVYNCKALHWACVDGPSYKICEQNAAYLQDNNKAPECYPFNIYETSHGCTSMQNRMVSSGANTDFCNGF